MTSFPLEAIDKKPHALTNIFLYADYLALTCNSACEVDSVDDVCSKLQQFNIIYFKANLHIGDHVLNELVLPIDFEKDKVMGFQDFNLTRPWRDGGRDALGYYVIGSGSKANYPL